MYKPSFIYLLIFSPIAGHGSARLHGSRPPPQATRPGSQKPLSPIAFACGGKVGGRSQELERWVAGG